MSLLLSVRGVKTFYGRVMALKGVDLDVNEGEIVTLILSLIHISEPTRH